MEGNAGMTKRSGNSGTIVPTGPKLPSYASTMYTNYKKWSEDTASTKPMAKRQCRPPVDKRAKGVPCDKVGLPTENPCKLFS